MSARLLALLLLCSIRDVDGSYHQYPGCQQCSCNIQLGTVDCSGSVSSLMSLPLADSLPRKGIRIFKFDHNAIDYVDQDFFLPFEDLVQISGNNNSLRQPFFLPRRLKSLHLTRNFLQTARGFFESQVSYDDLEFIDLSRNEIKHLESRSFFNLSGLNILSLTHNGLEKIESEGIGYLPHLSYLDLDHNKLESLTKHSFVSVGDSTTHWLKLSFRNNSIYRLTPDCLDLPTVGALRLTSNAIHEVDYRAFRSLPNLLELDLSGNVISRLEDGTFENHTWFISLDLSENNLTTIGANVFRKKTFISSFRANANSIRFLTNSFLETIRVNSLEISKNFLEELPASLSNQTALRRLHCAYNKLVAVRAHSFKRLSNLRFLNLMSNQISHFEDGAFSDLSNIRKIYIQDNPLHYLPRNAFLFNMPLGRVTEIYLRCSETNEIPLFSNTTHVYCITKATVITLKTTITSARYLSTMGYKCELLSFRDDVMGSASCTQCPVGTKGSTVADGQSHCSDCPPGGFYQDAAGKNSCTPCVEGTYVPFHESPGTSAADCVVCPKGTNTTAVANYRACFCLQNFYRLDRFGPCYRCSEPGQKCVDDYLSVQPGYWISWNISNRHNRSQLENDYVLFVDNLKTRNNSYRRDNTMKFFKVFPKIHPCPIEDSCNGTNGSVRIREGDMCSKGYEGPLCAVCQPRYYSWFQKCYHCPAAWRTGLQILGVAALFAVAMLILYFADKARRDKAKTLVDHIAAKIKIIIGFGQVMAGVFQALAYIPWPHLILKFGNYLKILELNVIAVATPSCLSDSLKLNALKAPIFSVSCQAGILCLIWAYYAIRYYAIAKCFRSTPATVRTVSLARTSCLRNTWWILFVSWPATTAQIMAVIPYKPWTCHELCLSTDRENAFCRWFLKDDLSLECDYESSWRVLWIICWFLILYVIALPVLLFIGLYFKQKRTQRAKDDDGELDDEMLVSLYLRPVPFRDNLTQSLHFLNENYKPKYWYWEVTELLRKFLLTCGIQFFGQTSHTNVAIAALLANLFLLLHAQLKPNKRTTDHWLQLTSLLVISLNLMLGTLMALSYQSDSGASDREVFSVLVLVVNGLFVLYVIGKVIIAFIVAWKEVKKNHRKFQLYLFLIYFVDGDSITAEGTELVPSAEDTPL